VCRPSNLHAFLFGKRRQIEVDLRFCASAARVTSLLSIKKNFLFIHLPKTGGNSIQSALFPYSEDKKVLLNSLHDGVDRFDIRSPLAGIRKHSKLKEFRDRLDAAQFDELFKFTCVRNPWERCVSFFFSPHRGGVKWSPAAFEDFVRTTVEPAQVFLQLHDDDVDPFDNVDAVIRFENIAGDFREVCDRIGIECPPLGRLNESNRRDHREYYRDDKMIGYVAEKFALEIKRFGYEFER